MENIDHDREAGRQLDDHFIVITLFLSVLFFGVINELLRHAPRHYVILQRTSEWRFRNLAISWVHAALCAMGCIYCYFKYGQYVESLAVLFDFEPLPAFLLTAFSAGYFIYDLLEHIREGKALALWEVMLHHIAVISIFTYNLTYHFCVAFAVLALSVEINSVFLHARKLLQMLDVPFSHWLYRTIVALNLVTFAVFRGMALALIWAGFLTNTHRCSATYTVSLTITMVFMTIINLVLFWRLLKSDILRSRRGKTTKVNGEVRENGHRGKTDSLSNGGGSHKAKDSCQINNNASPGNGHKVLHRTKAS
ncbi:TLC domain-containing protein 2-like [Littorina saxatilis]|uniref:TLC domain-containing protein n=1 Tax=Littorina saxatilis TaxID=31220 RepID=A0AAN9FXP9_9CAEN